MYHWQYANTIDLTISIKRLANKDHVLFHSRPSLGQVVISSQQEAPFTLILWHSLYRIFNN